MARLESDKVQAALIAKMRAEVSDRPGDRLFLIRDDDGVAVASTSISKGSKHTLGDARVRIMARQLCLNGSSQFVDLVSCLLDRDGAIAVIKTNCPPGTRRPRR